MPDNAQDCTKDLVDAFSELLGKSLVAFQLGTEQTTTTAKLFAAASETERAEAGNAWEQMSDYASGRNETVSTALADFCSGSANLETKEFRGKLIDQDRTFYQAWSDYLAGIQHRLGSLSKNSIEADARTVELSGGLVQSAVRYGEAVQAWSQKAAESVAPKTFS